MNILWWHPFKNLADDIAAKISDAITALFALLNRSIYTLFANAIDVMYALARRDLGLGSFVGDITEKLFYFLIIFMVFKLTLSVLSYLVNPDALTDKDRGAQNIIKRIIIAVALLIFINPIFDTLGEIQNDIIDNNLVQNIFSSTEKAGGNVDIMGGKAYPVHMSEYCDPDRYVYTFSQGDHMALMLFKEFYNATTEDFSMYDYDEVVDALKNQEFVKRFKDGSLKTIGSINDCASDGTCYCGTKLNEFWFLSGTMEFDVDNIAEWKKTMSESTQGPNSVKEFLVSSYYKNETIDFDFFMALIAGVFALLIAISFTFDVVIRSLTLFILQLVAPIPIISYMSPDKKSSEMLSTWGKKLASTWVSVFIRIMALSLGISLISYMSNVFDSEGTATTLVMKLFIFLGTLMFAKKLPQLLEELFPGLKLGSGLELNPFKRVRKDAIGGDLLMDTAGRAAGVGTGLMGGAIGGWKAGKEAGAPIVGGITGALSGMSTGFKNKKPSFGSGMNEAFKSITGNEMRRLTPANLLLPAIGKKKVAETKDFLGKAYDQLNAKQTDLSISENRSAALAEGLANMGYDYKHIDDWTDANGVTHQGLRSATGGIRTQIAGRQQQLNGYVSNGNVLAASANEAINEYNTAQANHAASANSYNEASRNYEDAQNRSKDLTSQINELQSELDRNSAEGKFTDGEKVNKLNNLKREKDDINNKIPDLKKTLDDAKRTMDDAKSLMDTAESTMRDRREAYDQNNAAINSIRDEIQSLTNADQMISSYISNREAEDALRKEISDISKDIDTIKTEKGQRENVYRIDSAPGQDYKKSTKNVTERDNN